MIIIFSLKNLISWFSSAVFFKPWQKTICTTFIMLTDFYSKKFVYSSGYQTGTHSANFPIKVLKLVNYH